MPLKKPQRNSKKAPGATKKVIKRSTRRKDSNDESDDLSSSVSDDDNESIDFTEDHEHFQNDDEDEEPPQRNNDIASNIAGTRTAELQHSPVIFTPLSTFRWLIDNEKYFRSPELYANRQQLYIRGIRGAKVRGALKWNISFPAIGEDYPLDQHWFEECAFDHAPPGMQEFEANDFVDVAANGEDLGPPPATSPPPRCAVETGCVPSNTVVGSSSSSTNHATTTQTSSGRNLRHAATGGAYVKYF
jgi:hypothetical protein